MVDIPAEVNRKQNSMYVSKHITRQLGYELNITPDTRAALIYPRNATIPEILVSLRHLRDHFKTLMEMK